MSLVQFPSTRLIALQACSRRTETIWLAVLQYVAAVPLNQVCHVGQGADEVAPRVDS